MPKTFIIKTSCIFTQKKCFFLSYYYYQLEIATQLNIFCILMLVPFTHKKSIYYIEGIFFDNRYLDNCIHGNKLASNFNADSMPIYPKQKNAAEIPPSNDAIWDEISGKKSIKKHKFQSWINTLSMQIISTYIYLISKKIYEPITSKPSNSFKL